MRANARHVLLWLLTVGPLVACEHETSAKRTDAPRASRLVFKRSMHPGDSLSQLRLPCSDGLTRTVGVAGAHQLVTFASLGDCDKCALHPVALDMIWRSKRLAVDLFTVALAVPKQRAAVTRAMASATQRPVCFDSLGTFWRRHDLEHTPVTFLLRGTQILYISDEPFADSISQEAFVDTLRRLLRANE